MPQYLLHQDQVDTELNKTAPLPTQVTRALLPLLEKHSPSIVLNIGSMGVITGLPYLASYTVSKAFNLVSSEAMRMELRVVCVRNSQDKNPACLPVEPGQHAAISWFCRLLLDV